MGSPPSRGRGLKLFVGVEVLDAGLVAPFTGAWIETRILLGYRFYLRSPPSRGRGLKLHELCIVVIRCGRPLHGGVD